jgi:hypothetical protein
MKQKAPALWVALFFAVLTLVGLLTSGDYGLPLDGPSEQVILQENLKEYAVQLFGQDSDAARGYDALGIGRITESIEMDHGQAAYYPAAPLLGLKESNPRLFNTLWHAYTWLWFMAAVLAAYALSRSLGLSRVLACATALMLYLSPRFFAEGHYNNKDVILLALSLCTMAAGVRFLQKPALRRALLFALFGALAANTRIIGLFVFGVTGIAILASMIARHALRGKALTGGLAAIAGFLAAYALLTPAFLANPPGFISHVLHNAAAFSRWTGVVIYKGAVYDPTGGLKLPHSYLPTMIALTVPVSVLALSAIGGVYAVYRCAVGDSRRPALIALLMVLLVPLVYAVIAQPLMYNGWRHFYFLYGPMIVLSGLGLRFLQRLLVQSRWGKTAGAAALALLFLYQGVGIARNHPYEYAYYNELAGDVQNRFELDYWEVSTLNALETLVKSGERNPALPLTLGGGDPMSLFSLNQSVQMLPNDVRAAFTVTEDADPPYIFSNATYAQIYSQKPGENYRALFSIESYGNLLCTVYERRN